MSRARTALATGAVALEACLAALGVLLHHGLTAEYGDVTDGVVEAWLAGITDGTGGITLVLVGVAGLVAVLLATRAWVRVVALALPVLVAVTMLAVTPLALDQKLATQYDAAPRCVPAEGSGAGPGAAAARRSQQVLDSLDHVGLFAAGGGSGIGGCDRSFVLTEDVDVLAHYRGALADQGWRVVLDGDDRVRAERDGTAFEVTVCGDGGLVWAGAVTERGPSGCDRDGDRVTGSG